MSTAPYQAFRTPLHAQRFISRIDIQDTAELCWPWLAGQSRDGYGKFRDGWSNVQTHKKMYEWVHGVCVPSTLHVMHLCHVRICCNPFHLEVGTQQQNNRATVEAGNHCNTGAKRGKLTQELANEIRARYHAGLTDPSKRITQYELFMEYGISREHVKAIIAGRAWSDGADWKAKATEARFNLDKARQVRALYASGQYTQRELATQFGVCRDTITSVLAGRTYREP